MWETIIESAQEYISAHLMRAGTNDEWLESTWSTYKEFYEATRSTFPLDSYFESAHTRLVDRYNSPPTESESDAESDAESDPALERSESPLTDEDIDEALYTIEAAWDY